MNNTELDFSLGPTQDQEDEEDGAPPLPFQTMAQRGGKSMPQVT